MKGARGKYNKKMLSIVEKMRRDGATDKEIYEALNINHTTFYEWLIPDTKRFKKEFKESYARGREIMVQDIENAMLKKAKGFEYEEMQTTFIPNKDGKPTQKESKRIRKYFPPDPSAAQLLLQAEQPDKYSTRQKTEHSGVIQNVNRNIDLSKRTDEEIDLLIAQAKKEIEEESNENK